MDARAPASSRDTAPAAALPTLLAVMFVNMVGFGIVVPLLPFYARSFQAPAWQMALIFSAYAAGAFFGEPFWGRISDRIGAQADPDQHGVRQLPVLSGAGLRAEHLRCVRRAADRRHGERQRLRHPGLHRRRDAGERTHRTHVDAGRGLQSRLHRRARARRIAGQSIRRTCRLPPAADRGGQSRRDFAPSASPCS